MKKIIPLFLLIGILNLSFTQALPPAQEDPRVQKIYAHFQQQLLWIKDNGWTPFVKQFLEVLSHMEEERVWAEDYLPFVEKLQTTDLTSSENQKEADALLTLAFLNYISDMRGERLNPHGIDKDIFIKPTPIDETKILEDYLSSSPTCE